MVGIDFQGWKPDVIAALSEIRRLHSVHPEEVALFSAAKQLEYLLALTDGVEVDDRALEEINLGSIAMYQLGSVATSELGEQLSTINEQVRRFLRMNGRRLKIDQ